MASIEQGISEVARKFAKGLVPEYFQILISARRLTNGLRKCGASSPVCMPGCFVMVLILFLKLQFDLSDSIT